MSENNQGGRGNGSSSNRNTRGGRVQGRNNNNIRRSTQFKGACEDLKDHVYTVGDAKQADRYTKTTEQILNYIQREYDQGQEVKDSLEQLEEFDMELYKPEKPDDMAALDDIDKMILQQEVKDYCTRKFKFNDNMNKAFALIHGQCSMGVKNKLENRKDWKFIKDRHNPILLLKAIKEITQNYQDSKYPIASIHKSIITLFTIKQDEKEGLAAYTKRFKNAQDIMEAQHGKLTLEQYVKKMPDYDVEENEEYTEKAYKSLMAYTFIMGADPKKSGKLAEDLANNFALGDDKYPKDLSSATDALVNYRNSGGNKNKNPSGNGNRNGRSNPENQTGFVQSGKQNGKTGRKIICFACGEEGHMARDCPKINRNESTNAQTHEEDGEGNHTNQDNNATQLFQAPGTQVNHSWNMAGAQSNLRDKILLDNQSTADVFCNLKYLSNIHQVPQTLKLHTNGGVLTCNTKGHLKGYGPVWCHKDAIANVISMSNAERSGRYDIKYERTKGFIMTNKETGNVTTFTKDNAGLHTAPLDARVALF